MRDPHVERLVYELQHDHTVRYRNPPPVEADREAYRLVLSEGRLHAEMQGHYARVAEARERVEPYLRVWEMDALLRSGGNHLRFAFVDADVIDRNPPGPGEPQVLSLSSSIAPASGGSLRVIAGREAYPPPPTYGALSPDAETLATRYRGYREGREPLLAMAYFCFTVVTNGAGGLKKAALRYRVSRQVLKKISELSSTRGDRGSARKYDSTRLLPLSAGEQVWLEHAIRRLARQVAAVDAGEEPGVLTMNALPGL